MHGVPSILAILLCCCAVSAGEAPAPSLRVFDASAKVLVTIDNSHRCAGPFRRKIQRWFGGGDRCPITFRGVGGWGTPVDPETGQALQQGAGWLAGVSFEKEAAAGTPVVVVALCGISMPRAAKKGEQQQVDDALVARGVKTLEGFVALLETRGARLVVPSTYHYFEGTNAPGHRSQYDVDFTLRALAAYRQAHPDRTAIDLITPTRAVHPAHLADDLFHPGDAGRMLMAQCWFEALLAREGLEVPAWSREETEAALAAARAGAGAPGPGK